MSRPEPASEALAMEWASLSETMTTMDTSIDFDGDGWTDILSRMMGHQINSGLINERGLRRHRLDLRNGV